MAAVAPPCRTLERRLRTLGNGEGSQVSECLGVDLQVNVSNPTRKAAGRCSSLRAPPPSCFLLYPPPEPPSRVLVLVSDCRLPTIKSQLSLVSSGRRNSLCEFLLLCPVTPLKNQLRHFNPARSKLFFAAFLACAPDQQFAYCPTLQKRATATTFQHHTPRIILQCLTNLIHHRYHARMSNPKSLSPTNNPQKLTLPTPHRNTLRSLHLVQLLLRPYSRWRSRMAFSSTPRPATNSRLSVSHTNPAAQLATTPSSSVTL